MITEKEVPVVLHSELPEIHSSHDEEETMYEALQDFAEYTKSCLKGENAGRIQTCLNLAEKLFREGNEGVRSAVENVYLYSITSFIEMFSSVREKMAALLPENMKNSYSRQIKASYP